jgi:GTP-binding protein HflX
MLKAILVDCIPPALSKEDADHRLAEAESLIKTYGGIVVIKKIQKRQTPDLRTFIGSGKLHEIMEESKTSDANILIINNELKPHQTYNINEELRKEAEADRKLASQARGKIPRENLKPAMQAWDRIDLILKIFQKHATTREAKLEIELASIKHMGPRIFGMGMQLSRQGGGIGTRGSGETNIEAMKRHLRKMEDSIDKELEAYKKVRKIHRDSRKRRELKTVGIIGYTNAGKSTLLNTLTRKGAYVADKLFATLDTRVGKMYIPQYDPKNPHAPAHTRPPDDASVNPAPTPAEDDFSRYLDQNGNFVPLPVPHEVLISDTIGFIENLPTTLIKSFQSTLEETLDADILLHVIDVSDPRFLQKIEVVNEILFQIDALMKPTIYVFNKIDRLSDLDRRLFEDREDRDKVPAHRQIPNTTPDGGNTSEHPQPEQPSPQQALPHSYPNRRQLQEQFKVFHPCFVSAVNKEGTETLKEAIRDALFPQTVPPSPTGVLDVIKDLKNRHKHKSV